MLGLLVVGILFAGSSPGYGQGLDPGFPPTVSDLNGLGPEAVPIVTRAGAHDDFGRMVFDWPWAVAYGARIEGRTLTVMFDRRLHTTFQEIPQNLGAYVTDVELGPDGQSIVASLTSEYRLRTFLLNNEDGGVKVVVDLLADGEAGPVLAQAPTPPPAEPSPEAVPGDVHPSPLISGDSPLPLAEAAPVDLSPNDAEPAPESTPETAPTPNPQPLIPSFPPSLPFAVEADAPPESEGNPPRPYGPPLQGGDEEEPPLLGGVPRQRRGGSTPVPPLSPAPNGEQTTGQDAEQAAVPALGMETEPAGEEPTPALRATPPERGSEEGAASPVKADADTPPAEPDSSPESVPTAEATPPVETTATPEQVTEPAPEAAPPAETATAPEAASESSPPGRPVLSPVEGGAAQRRGGSTDAPPSPDSNGEQTTEQSAEQAVAPPLETALEPVGEEPTPALRATPPERGSEEATLPVKADADVPPAEPTPETASEETSPVETAEASPHPEEEVVAPTLDAPAEETVAASEDVPPAETAETAAVETPPVTTDPNPESPTPNQAGHPQGGAPTPDPSSQFPTLPVSVRIPLSQSRLFRLETPVASVFVANPEIADVQLVSSGVLFVVAKAVGRTSVAALDADSELVGEWTIATVLDIQPARAAIEGVPALRNVVVRQLNRGVELSGAVASIATADLALRLTTTALPEETPVENRISVTGKQQVNLEVQIAEVQRSVSETLGFNWEVVPDIGGERLLGFQVGRFLFDEATGRFLRRSLPEGTAAALTGSTGVSPGRTTVRGLIDALATAGLATVLARPNVTAVSGETASFFSGGEYPLPSGFEDGAIIFEYKKYGVLLDFVPTIIDSGRIMLTVRPEVSQRSDTDSLRAAGIDIPVINVRRAETTVEVGDGESIVIAGLYRDQSEAVEAGLPVVKDIPLLGMLFGSQSVRSNATELIVVVTARLTTATTMPRTTDQDRQLPGRRLRGYHY